MGGKEKIAEHLERLVCEKTALTPMRDSAKSGEKLDATLRSSQLDLDDNKVYRMISSGAASLVRNPEAPNCRARAEYCSSP